jgi:zinc protease
VRGLALFLLAVAAGLAQTGGRRGAAPPAPVRKAAEAPVPVRTASLSPGGTRDLKFPPLHTVQPAKLVTATLPNGLRVYLSEDRELPVIGGVVMIRTGDALDPPERIGMAAAAMYLLRAGGTRLKPAPEVEESLGRLGMTVESASAETSATVTFSALRRNAEDSLTLLREMLLEAEFRVDSLETSKARTRDAIAHRNEEIPALMRRELSGLIFGKSSPYGWQADYAGTERITRTDLKKFHQRYFFPANVMLGVRGDFDAAEMQAMVEKVFGGWTATGQKVAEFPKAAPTPAPGIYLGEMRDVPVSHIMVGQPGGSTTEKDYPALEVMGLLFNQVQARITQRARAPLGGVNLSLMGVAVDDAKGKWDAAPDHAGTFRVYGTCRGAATAEAIKAIQGDIEHMRTVEVSEEELRVAREGAINALAAEWDTGAKAFQRQMIQEYYGLPRDFAQRYQAGLMAVTRADILRVAKEYLKPAGMTTIVIGNPQVFSTPLEKLNPQINRIDLTLPSRKPAVTESTDATIAEGKRLLQRAAAAVGGAEKLAAVKDYVLTTEFHIDPLVADIGGYKVPQTDRWLSPDFFRQDLVMPRNRISAYSSGKSGWIVSDQGWGPLAGVQLKQLQGDLFRSYFRLLLSDRVEGRTVNAVDQDVVEITDTIGQLVRIEFDSQTGLPRRATYDVQQAGGAPLFTEETYGDYREVDGVKFPFQTVITQSGRKFADVTVTELKINSGLRQVELAMRPQ